jgi:hypothetical protein
MTDFLKNVIKDVGNEYASLVIDGVEAGDVDSFIDTGSYIFNGLLSGSLYGGLAANKITALAGESATGKTYFLMGIVKNFLDKDPNAGVIYFESESAITKQMVIDRGIDPNRIYVGGSSAGGHLTGMMVAGGWQEEYGLPTDVIKGGVPMSGLFDMEPIVKCFVNEWMQMSTVDGVRNSPVRNLPARGCPLIVAVGGDETDEFRRQSKDFSDLWKSQGWAADYLECQGIHHFNAPLELCNSDSELTQKLLAMVGQ